MRGIRDILHPTERAFYDLLEEAGETIVASAGALEELLSSDAAAKQDGEAPPARGDMSESERESDRVKRAVIELTRDSFVMPYDREDIFGLATVLDETVDRFLDVAEFAQLANIGPVHSGAEQLVPLVAESARLIAKSLEAMRKNKSVSEFTAQIERLEHEGFKINRRTVVALFAGESEPIDIMRHQEFLERLTAALRATAEAGDLLDWTMIKHA